MAYTYHDWQQQTDPAARLTRLRQHLAEVSALISASISANGSSRSASDLRQYWKDLTEEEKSLIAEYGLDGATPAVRVGVVRVGRISQ